MKKRSTSSPSLWNRYPRRQPMKSILRSFAILAVAVAVNTGLNAQNG
jgi:hypothetical protein